MFFNRDSTNSNNQDAEIDTRDVAETSFNWEDIVDINVLGDEGSLIIEFTYKEIPDLRTKIDDENAKWEEKRWDLAPNADQEIIQVNLNWLEDLNKLYSTDFCEAPADLNNHKEGDTIKITCDSETLRKLNYKFNDGFEYTLSDIYGVDTDKEYLSNTEKDTENTDTEKKESSVSETTSENLYSDIYNENHYWELGNDVFININDISSAKLDPVVSDEQRIFLVVNNEEDFQIVKEYVLKHTENTYVIEYDGYWYGVNGDFEEREICKGITLGE